MNIKQDISLSFRDANVYSAPFALAALLFAVPFARLWGVGPLLDGFVTLFAPPVILPSLIFGVVAHELLHGLAWVIGGRKSRRAIQFGFHWRTLTPYAHCVEPLMVNAYRIGGATPGVLLGVAPCVVATWMGNGGVLWFGILFIMAAAGDALSLWLIRHVSSGALVRDHPSRMGCYVLDTQT